MPFSSSLARFFSSPGSFKRSAFCSAQVFFCLPHVPSGAAAFEPSRKWERARLIFRLLRLPSLELWLTGIASQLLLVVGVLVTVMSEQFVGICLNLALCSTQGALSVSCKCYTSHPP